MDAKALPTAISPWKAITCSLFVIAICYTLMPRAAVAQHPATLEGRWSFSLPSTSFDQEVDVAEFGNAVKPSWLNQVASPTEAVQSATYIRPASEGAQVRLAAYGSSPAAADTTEAISNHRVIDVTPAQATLNRVERSSTASVRVAARAQDSGAGSPTSESPTATTDAQPNITPKLSDPASTTVPSDASTVPSAINAVADVPISAEMIDLRRQQALANNTLDTAVRDELVKLYEAILADVLLTSEQERKAREFTGKAEGAPAAIAEAKRKLESPVKAESLSNFQLQTTRLEDLQSMLQQQQTLLKQTADTRSTIENTIVSRETQKQKLPKLISDAKAQQVKLSEELAASVLPESDSQLAEAKNWLTRAKLASSIAYARMLEQELRVYEAETELLPLQQQLLAQEEKVQQARLKEINAELENRRETSIYSYRHEAEAVLMSEPTPEDSAIADNMIKRVDDWLKLVKVNRDLERKISESEKRYETWDEHYSLAQKRIEKDASLKVGGLNSWTGFLLRRQRSELPSVRALQHEMEDYQEQFQEYDSLALELEDWLVRAKASSKDDDEQSELKKRELALIGDYKRDVTTYTNHLIEIADKKNNMIRLVERYRALIDQHVLWIRSTDPIGTSDAQKLWPALTWIFGIDNWQRVATTLVAELRSHLTESILAVAVFIILIFNTRKLRNRIREYGEAASRASNTLYMPTLKVVVLTLIISAPWAALLAFLGLRLYAASNADPFVQNFGFGVLTASRFFFVMEVLRQVSRQGGLSEKHLNWPANANNILRRNLRWFIDLSMPMVALVAMVFDGGDDNWESSLGRLTYFALMALFAIAIANIFHPRRGVLSEYIVRHQGGWIDRLRYIWFVGLVAAPVFLAVASAIGYHYTSVRLAVLLYRSALTLTGIFILYNLATRWLLLSRRRLAIAHARQRLEEAQREAAISQAGNSIPNDVRSTEFRNEIRNEQNAVDLAAINAQTMSLVSACAVVAAMVSLSFIWSDVLPAVSALESIAWPIKDNAGNVIDQISLASILFSIPVAVLTIFAARNLPGLLEIALLQHLPIENAVRYAITTVSRYALLMIGIVLTCNYLGIRWSNVQWLVAALGVGLGFGLQEIFANFISGLILLFEQPIRVGDVITIDNTSGAVAKIRMRATTITNWDRQELIVPNKDLITGRLLNWTLSDSTNRMVIEVTVAYGSDTELACKILMDLCTAHSNVLSDPPPTAFLDGFLDSSIKLSLRFFLQTLDIRLKTRHDLLTSIHNEFAAAGIEIAFPQRDLHVRSLPTELSDFLSRGKLQGTVDAQSSDSPSGPAA